ncbi:thiamine phosphate synthase [Pontibacter sp. SGAir0037]|uniref:thiamine phosphate synthase n=1 Tax=Pontibacter sp. SGAir0037 TaxID=2571030 RepID=UPI0010CCEC09|nr:thiamine phosphate synthase [Pontibacter sp. SGAir0037]QCR24541.1 thiamine phosphate synthase [Pontibacter sp. SGAir0037]
MKKIAKLHYITQAIAGKNHSEAAAGACAAGVDWVQLRVKNASYNLWKEEALRTQEICRHYGATFIINDNVALAAEVGADGVHLGKTDMAPAAARKLMGTAKIIGGTANTFEDIQRLIAAEVDYIGLGPFRFTSTKENLSPILGLNGYEQLLQQCTLSGITTPVVAIGGITPTDIAPLLQVGIHGIAVSSGINMAQDKKQAVSQLTDELYQYQTK